MHGRDLEYLGEVYRFCCPFCGDRKWRGWVSHVYGARHPRTGAVMDPVGCFNDTGCYRDGRRRSEFGMLVYGAVRPDLSPVDARPSFRASEAAPVALPGATFSLADLTDGHPARTYVAERGFDPDVLASLWFIGYCSDVSEPTGPRDALALNRLIIPLLVNGEVVGWQARALADGRNVKRYLTYKRPGVRGALYGIDNVSPTDPVVVVVEGATDVWSLGPGAVGAMTCSLSPSQAEALAPWGRKGATAVIWFDGGAEKRAQEAERRLAPFFDGRVVRVIDPEPPCPGEWRRGPQAKVDVGEYTYAAARARVERALSTLRQGP